MSEATGTSTWESLSTEISGERIRVGVLIEFVSDALASMQQGALRPYIGQGITSRDDFRTLAVIRWLGERGASITEISETLRSTPGTISNRVERLHKEELLTRSPHERDRRSHRVRFTPKGEALIEEMIQTMIGIHESFFQALDASECEKLSELLETCVSAVPDREWQR